MAERDGGAEAARLYLRAEMEAPQVVTLASGQAVVFARRNPMKSGLNEDAAGVLISADGVVLAVADGMGGGPAGEASAEVLESLAREIGAEGGERTLRVRIMDGIEVANDRILERAPGAKTTLVLVALEGDVVRPYHVGDSEVLVVGQRGRLKLRIVAHSPVAYAVEAGVLDAAEAMHHQDRHFVSNVVGSSDMRIEVGPPLTLAPHDTVLLGTDGLFDNLALDEIVERIRKGPLEEAARRLVADVTRRMTDPESGAPSKPDDLSFVLFRPSPRQRP